MIDKAAWSVEKPTEEDIRAKQDEWFLITTAFARFLRWVKIVEAPTLENPGGVIKMDLWDHLRQMAATLLSERLVSILKSRQIGASWMVAAWVLWNCLTKPASRWMLYSKGEQEAIELLSKCKRIYNNLPNFLKIKMARESSTEVTFENDSVITAMAATETAGIGFQVSGIVWDEHEQHPYADQNYAMAKPTIDAGGQIISVFTVDKSKPKTLAKTIFREALKGNNGYKALFFPYTVRPGRDEKWYQDTMKSIPVSDLGTLTPEMYMAQNYPRSIEEALSSLASITAFDHNVLTIMREDTRPCISKNGIDTKLSHIFKDYSPGALYVAGTDTSHGVGKDYSVTVVVNVKTGEVVADVMSNTIRPDYLARCSMTLLEIYGNPLWWIEDNDEGSVTVNTARNLKYMRLGYQDKNKTRPGFSTKEHTRDLLWGELISGVNSRQLIIYNMEGLSQFYDVIRNVEKQGRIEAVAGGHDDYPMAVGIAWLKRTEVNQNIAPAKPIETLTFNKERGLVGIRR